MNTLPDISTLSTPDLSKKQLDYILLDGSASMELDDRWFNALDSIDAYISGVQAGHIDSDILIHVFDTTDLEYIARNQHISKWVPLSQDPIGAHFGGTPLYDAITLMGRTFRNIMPVRGTGVIVTDGGEADSSFTDLHQAKGVLNWMRAKGWPVIFLGADFDNATIVRELGANPDSALSTKGRMLPAAAKLLAQKRTHYGRTGEDIGFTGEEKTKFGGFLSGPSGK